MIRLLLVDDHAVVREGYRRLLERRGDLHIVAEAGTAGEALNAFREHGPDVVVLDLALPDMGGVELIGRLRARDANARILAFSMHREPLFAAQALKAGALGYVTKSSEPNVLVQAVYKVASGARMISPDIAPELAMALLDEAPDPLRDLSPREFEVLRLLLDGHSHEAIGQRLSISPKTVQNCHYQIKSKVGAKNDMELARIAARCGLST
ncbi:response regulator transcription factor [Nitrogeniibacter mangrovi]|uniref:Response regulator transcription factor n=2 Tax=Nitrogeniibacter mangrovi TaxID=2016596 RepID=A0A6C1BAL5_9RHOO|nr:response regulator transcription factor [Nitrogeniibacter mangrovi]